MNGPAARASGRPGGLRVLHVTTTISRGGAENHLYDLIRGQVEQSGTSVACAYLKGDGYWREPLERLGVQVTDLGLRRYGSPRPLLRLRRMVARFRPHVVHAHGAPAEIYAWAALPRLGRAPSFIVTRHEHRTRLFSLPGYRLLDRAIAASADRIIAVSDAVKASDVARRPEIAEKAVVVHHGLDLSALRAAPDARRRIRGEWGVSDDAVLIGTLARHSCEKSLDTPMRAVAALIDSGLARERLALALVGSGPLSEELKALAQELGIADRMVWPGYRYDVGDVLSAFDIFILPSVEEGFGLAVIEAMAASLPVVTSSLDSLLEIVEPGRTGIVFPPGDDAALAAALRRLVDSPAERRMLGADARQRVEGEFTLEAMWRKTAATYDAALAARGSLA